MKRGAAIDMRLAGKKPAIFYDMIETLYPHGTG